ncbi:hypothetical protein [uncultured Pedobacter sp.]|uniref:hypothetical protein n=1 Tax=uncultured Pedobacter sp. TaxID=246139 RepID=UPI0025EBBCBE|nr:hypothetical protein [uncultured Pedobacter sp.]
MLRCTLSLLIFLFSFLARSQTVVSGRLLSTGGEPVPHGSVSVIVPADSTLISFVLSDAEGWFRLSFESKVKKLQLAVKAMNYETLYRSIENQNQQLNFNLRQKVIELAEVDVRKPPIVKRGDTLSYDLNSFASLQDRTLGDVLKKVPGIEVSANGQIRYQGLAINKFYVEGKDLMAGNYGIITNSLPNIDIDKLEILPNHQPIRLLKDKLYSPRAAINIKLKKNVTTTGRGEIGAGLSPLAWQTKLTPMVFSKKYQSLLNYKSNNIGEDITKEMNNLGVMDVSEGITKDVNNNKWISISQPTFPTIAQERYLFNRTHAASANLLFNLTRKMELSGNVSYLNDRTEQEEGQETIIKQFDSDGNQQGIISYGRSSITRLAKQQISARLILTQNTDSNFLKNILFFKHDRSSDIGNIRIEQSSIEQDLHSPEYALQNSLSAIIPIGTEKKYSVNLQSYINFSNARQQYQISPLKSLYFPDMSFLRSEVLVQELYLRRSETKNTLSSSLSFNDITLTPKFGLQADRSSLRSGISDINAAQTSANKYINNIIYNVFTSFASLDINYNGRKLKILTSFPAKVNNITALSRQYEFSRELHLNTFEPSLQSEYRLSNRYKIVATAAVSNDFATLETLYPGYIFSGLDLNAYGSDISRTKTQNLGTNLVYENVLDNTSFNIGYNYSNKLGNVIFNRKVYENGQQVLEALNMENPQHFTNYQITLGKFFSEQKINTSLTYLISNGNTNSYVNGNFLNSRSHGQSIILKLNYNKLKWLNIDYYATASFNRVRNNFNVTRFNSFSQKSQLFISPFLNHNLDISFDQFEYSFLGNTFINSFLDLGYRFSWAKRKIDFDLKWANILNTNSYRQLIVNENQTTEDVFKLRPSQLVFAVKFNFR